MTKSEIETKVRRVLVNFESLPFDTLRDLVLCRSGNYDLQNEAALKDVLRELTDRGVVGAADRQFGPFWLPARSAAARGGVSGAVIAAATSARATLRRGRR